MKQMRQHNKTETDSQIWRANYQWGSGYQWGRAR